MADEIVMIGGGIVGLTTAMLLAKDGHRVTVLERDPDGPPKGNDEAWEAWNRRSVAQFRQVHFLQPRFRAIIESELPEALAEVQANGALRLNVMEHLPPQLTGGLHDEDARFTTWTGRRPMVERAFALAADITEGVTVQRGVVVRGLVADDDRRPDGVPHVTGVATDGGILTGDLVVDASGRRSALPTWLDAIGAPAVDDRIEDSGFAYYTRHFRSADGSVPPMIGPLLAPYGSLSLLTLPADNGTWGVGIIASAKDRAMRAATAEPVWTAVVQSFPLSAHWIDAEPICGVDTMTNVPDRIRKVVVDGEPVVTGLLPVADAWACTNPSLGRGITLGAMHALDLRDAIRDTGTADGRALALRLEERAAGEVEPWFEDTLAFDRHRLAEIEACIEGRRYETDDPAWLLGRALASAATKDPELIRHYLGIIGVLTRGVDAMSQPGVAEQALALASDDVLPGPDRAGIEAILAGAAG